MRHATASHNVRPAAMAIPAPPCDACEIAEICRDHALACRDFSNYIETASKKSKGVERIPRQKIYRRLFPGAPASAATVNGE